MGQHAVRYQQLAQEDAAKLSHLEQTINNEMANLAMVQQALGTYY